MLHTAFCTRFKRRSAVFLLLLCLPLLLSGCAGKVQEEARHFMPVEGAAWGMTLEDAEALLAKKSYTYEKDTATGSARLKITGAFPAPFGLQDAEEIYLLFSPEGILNGGSVVLSATSDADAVAEALTKRFGASDEQDAGAPYRKSSEKSMKDFPDEAEKFMNYYRALGLSLGISAGLQNSGGLTFTDESLEKSLSTLSLSAGGGEAPFLSITARYAAVLALISAL